MPRIPTYTTLTGTILADTGKAIKLKIDKVGDATLESSITHWIPISQIPKMFKDPNETGADWVMATEWICKTKELI